MLGSSGPEATSGASSGEPVTLISRLEEGNLRRKSQSLPPLDIQESRASGARQPESGGNEHRSRRHSSNGGSGRRPSSNADNTNDLHTNIINRNDNTNGSYGSSSNSFPEPGPLSSVPHRDEVRLSPGMSSMGSRTSQSGGVEGGGDGGADGGEEQAVDSDHPPALAAPGVDGMGGGDSGVHHVDHVSDANNVPSEVGDSAADARLDPDDLLLRRMTEREVIQEIDTMRRSIELRSSANGADTANVDGSGENVRVGEARRSLAASSEVESAGGGGQEEALGPPKLEAGGGQAIGGEETGANDDEDGPQRLFIGWMQARQREFVIVISLGCVTALFATHVAQEYNGTLAMTVTFIPVVVHLLLVRDIYVKWRNRQRIKQLQLQLNQSSVGQHDSKGGNGTAATRATNDRQAVMPSGAQSVRDGRNACNHTAVVEGVDGLDAVSRAANSSGRTGGRGGMSSSETFPPSSTAEAAAMSRVGGDASNGPFFAGMDLKQGDGKASGGIIAGHRSQSNSGSGTGTGSGSGENLGGAGSVNSSNESTSSSNRSGMLAYERGRRADGGSEGEDSWSDLGGARGSENMMSFLETPFQKSVRLLNAACDSVSDPVVRKVIKKVAKLLSDPDSLHKVRDGSIRRVTMDLGTRSYIENVLQTPVKSTSAEDNWKKLRTGMFVVRAMAKEAAAAEDFLSAYENRQLNKGRESPGGREGNINNTDSISNHPNERSDDEDINSRAGDDDGLEDLLEDIASGVDTTTQDITVIQTNNNGKASGKVAAYRQEHDSATRFSNFNRNLILGQQLVAKTLSRGDLRKDPDRLSVGELRNLVSEHKTPEKIMEHPLRVEDVASKDGEEGVRGAEEIKPEDAGERNEVAHSNSASDDVFERMLIPRLPILDESQVGDVASLLADGGFLRWDFNVFSLEERSQGHSLWFAAMSAFSHYNLIGAFGLGVDRLSQLFLCVEASYCFDPDSPNSYHTHVHAADVTLTVSHFLSVEAIANTVRSTHGLALLMAAIMHDYRHPGVNNGYLVRDLDPLAVVYNDASVLENFHASEGFKMMLDPTFDILKGWKSEDVKFFRHAFVKCILATDLALSLEYVSKFQTLTANMDSDELSGCIADKAGRKPSMHEGSSIQVQILVLQMVLKVADVAHPCKPWEVHHKWSELVTEEFFKQGDKEAARGLAVSPLCNRSDQNLPKSQCDFIDFIVRPCVSIFSVYCKVTTWNDQLDCNFRAWRALYEEQGGSTKRLTSPGAKRRSLR